MYTIIGGDGKEYGPVSAEQIRIWIAAGRANADTRAKIAGSDEWRRLDDFIEFGGTEAGPTAAAPEAAPFAGHDPEAIAAALIARAAKLDIGSCYERSWNLVKARFWPFVGTTVLVAGVEIAAWTAPVIHTVSWILAGVFSGGYNYYILKASRGQPVSLGDAFAGFRRAFFPLLLTGVVMGLLTTLGLILLVLPGIYLAIAYLFSTLFVIDRGLGFWTAMEVSRRVITAQWWRLLGLMALGLLFCLLGCALLVVGLAVAIPLVSGAIVYAYRDLCEPPSV